MSLEIMAEEIKGVAVLAPSGRLDTNTAKLLEERVREAAETQSDALLIDMGGVDYVSSFGLRVILGAAKTYKARDGRLVLCGLRKDVMNVFRISGFLKILTVTEDRDTALADLCRDA